MAGLLVRRPGARLRALAALGLLLGACSHPKSVIPKEDSVGPDAIAAMTQDKRFEDIPYGSHDETSGTPPEPDIFWQGLSIGAPALVLLEPAESGVGFAPLPSIPICGRVKLLVLEIPSDGPIRVSARNLETELVLSATLGEEESGTVLEDPGKPLDDSLFEGVTTTQFFNEDLTALLGLPSLPAQYELVVQFGEFVSNPLPLEIREP